MAYTRDSLRAVLAQRLKDGSNVVWTTGELDGYLNQGIEGLYPAFYQRQVGTTAAGAGPLQASPAGARNLYMIGLQAVGSTRVRKLRSWAEGNGQAYVPKTGITGATLVWCWTEGWTQPTLGSDPLTFPNDAVEVLLIRTQIAALESLIADKVSLDRYHALQVRQVNSEDDILNTLDALHASLRERLDRVQPLPEVIK